MSTATVPVQQATIRQYAKQLQLTTIGGQFTQVAEQAVRQKQSHLSYLEALLGAEVEERDRNAVARRIKESHFPKVKTLEDFKFSDAPHLPAVQIRNLAEGGYLSRSEPIIFLGETGTGKTHLATGLAVAACRQKKRVRFTTAAEMVNELIEAKNQSELNRVTRRWTRYELIVIDELAYVAMPEAAAELLFQVIAGRAERAAVIVTTNLPFSEWTSMFPNARLCKAMLDRLTDQAHIIETGTESYRFRRTLETTLLRHIIGLEHPDQGRVLLADHESVGSPLVDLAILDAESMERIERHWAVVFQGNALLAGRSVEANISLPLREVQHLDESTIRSKVREAVREVALDPEKDLDLTVDQLSGGMAKRVAVAPATPKQELPNVCS